MQEFSLIILCSRRRHLLGSTLESLKGQKGSFEVLLVGADADGYPELKMSSVAAGLNPAMSMNKALSQATGKYVQFLEPGDLYISRHGLEFLSTLLEKEPSFILDQGAGGVPFFWIRKETLLNLGAFDEKLSFSPMQDFLHRLEKSQEPMLLCPRVIVDSPYEREQSVRETYLSLWKHFGLKRAMRWLLIENRSRVLERAATRVRESFWRQP